MKMAEFKKMLQQAAGILVGASPNFSLYFSNLIASCIGKPVENTAEGQKKGLEEFSSFFSDETEVSHKFIEEHPPVYALLAFIAGVINSKPKSAGNSLAA